MIITRGFVAKTTLSAVHWHGDYATYRSPDGMILAHVPSGESVRFVKGRGAVRFEREADAALAASTDADPTAWNAFCARFRDAMRAPTRMGGAPSSDGGFFAFA